MANHLFIGLGGTGGSILCALRKRMYEEFGSNDPAGGAYVEYLYVDSSPADLNDRLKWKTTGASVHLDDVQKVNIHGVGSDVLANLNQYSGIKSFINPEDRKLCDDLGSLISDGIGGQRRRLGRLLFANNIGGPQSFVTRLKERVQFLQNKHGDTQVTFHICAGLAGGTGSGSIIDTIAQIRKEYVPRQGMADQYRIELYLYIPEMVVVNPAHDKGFYQANGYAALQELNAMSVGVYRPTDVTGAKDEMGEPRRLLENCDAFESAYIFTNVNERGKQLKIYDELPAAVADFLFQKAIASEQIGTGKLNRLSKCENVGTTPERDGAGNPVHSRRFMTFGIKRVEYPENEIKEYVAYNFAAQAVNQFHYNKWVDGVGFDVVSEDEIGTGLRSEILEKKNLENLLLSDSILTLAKPVDSSIKGTEKWKEISVAWREWISFFIETTMEEDDKQQWISVLHRKVANQYDVAYRGLGVRAFYDANRRDIASHASFIRRNIERVLFTEWESGQKSILEVQKYISLLSQNCEERILKFKENISKANELVEGQLNENTKECLKEWNNIGWLKDAINHASEKVLRKYGEALANQYEYKTKAEGYRFACELMAAVINELSALKSSVDLFADELLQMTDMVKKKAESKCQLEESVSDVKIVKKYNPALVRTTTKQFVVNKEKQRENANEIRHELVALLGDEVRSFGKMFDAIGDLNTFEDIMLRVCIKNGNALMDELAKNDSMQKMTHVNVLEKIKSEYNTNEKLEAFVRELYNSSQCFLQFDASEMSGDKAGAGMDRMVQLCLPKYDDPTNFRQKFIDAFKSVCVGFQFSVNEDVSDNYKDNQIVVISAASGFPLRFVANVDCLRGKYEEKLKEKNHEKLNKMVLHTESLKSWPSLYNKKTQELIADLRPYIIKAFAMGLVTNRENPDTGEHYLALAIPDEYGFNSYVRLGKDAVQALNELSGNEKNADALAKAVDEKLAAEYVHNESKRELKKKIVDFINSVVLPLFNGNDQNREYQQFLQSARSIIENELKEQ